MNIAIAVLSVWMIAASAAAVSAGVGAEEIEKRRAAEGGLQAGMVLDQRSAPLAKGLLPEELLRHYERGEYANTVSDWPSGLGEMGADFEAQTRRNAASLTVDVEGTIRDKATGEQPAYLYGTPFPEIDPADPTAAVRLLWNYYYSYWWNGNNYTVSSLVWLSPSQVDRSFTAAAYFKQYEGVPPDFRTAENPNHLIKQTLNSVTAPADLHGTASLLWSYHDPRKRDSVWTYVPAMRRVRQVSPANRSDGFLGSDMSQDDEAFFAGKPQDFDWKLAGQAEVLRLVDPFRLKGVHRTEPWPGGGWQAVLQPVPFYGFEDPAWTGLTWAPVGVHLARRKVWIIEGVPKDRHYLYGKIQLWIDQENWQGTYNRKFSWNGELLNTFQTTNGPGNQTSGKYYTTNSPSVACWIAESLKLGRATVAAFGPADASRNRTNPVVYHLPIEANLFDSQSLNLFGK